MPVDLLLMSDPLIRRSRLSCATQAEIISSGHSLYPPGTRALARPEVASALAVAQSILRRYQYGLKIWDAYRPAAVQAKLWQASRNTHYVANPEFGVGWLLSLGIAVDATLVDSRNRDVRMPTDFDQFTPAAMEPFMGSSFEIGGRARLLNTLCTKLVLRAYAVNGGISPSLIGKNTCRLKKQRVPHKVLGTHWEDGL